MKDLLGCDGKNMPLDVSNTSARIVGFYILQDARIVPAEGAVASLVVHLDSSSRINLHVLLCRVQSAVRRWRATTAVG